MELYQEVVSENPDTGNKLTHYMINLNSYSKNLTTFVQWDNDKIVRGVLIIIYCPNCNKLFDQQKLFQDHLLFSCKEYMGKNLANKNAFGVFPLEVSIKPQGKVYLVHKFTLNAHNQHNTINPQFSMTYISNDNTSNLENQYVRFVNGIILLLTQFPTNWKLNREIRNSWPYKDFFNFNSNIFLERLTNMGSSALTWRAYNPRAKSYTLDLLWDLRNYEIVFDLHKIAKVKFYDCNYCDKIISFKLEAVHHAKTHDALFQDENEQMKVDAGRFECYIRKNENRIQTFSEQHLLLAVNEADLFHLEQHFDKVQFFSVWDNSWCTQSDFENKMHSNLSDALNLNYIHIKGDNVFERFKNCMIQLKALKKKEEEKRIANILSLN